MKGLQASIYLFLLTCFTFFNTLANIEINSNFGFEYIGSQGEIYIDSSRAESIQQVIGKKEFVKADDPTLSFGYTTTRIWIRFTIQNQTEEHQSLVVEVPRPHFNELELFEVAEDSIKSFGLTGVDFPFDQRLNKRRVFVYDINLNPNESKTYYLNIWNRLSAIHLPAKVWDNNTYNNNERKLYLGWGISFGIHMIIILFSFLLYLNIRDRLYLFYTVYVAVILIMHLYLDGFLFPLLWPNTPYINDTMRVAVPLLYMISRTKFSQLFIGIDKISKRLNMGINFLIYEMLLLLFISSFGYRLLQNFSEFYSIIFKINVILCLAVFLALIIVGVIKKSAQIKWYIISFLPYFIYTLSISPVFIKYTLAGLSDYFTADIDVLFYSFSMPICFVFEITILTIALAYRVKKIKDERETLLVKVTHQQEEQITAVINAQESERSRIAKELHDGVGQLLAGLKLKFGLLKQTKVIQEKEQSIIEDSNKVLDEAYNEVRTISHQMMPRALTELGLVTAVNDLLESTFTNTKINFEFSHFNIQERLPQDIELSFYRIIQELMSNIIKHAKANKISVQLFISSGNLVLIVEDNGLGMNVENASKGLGLKNIISRIKSIKGEVNFEKGPEKGTIVTARIPV